MPDLPISGLPNASALAGTEPVPIVQGGVTVKTTTADIAALASGGVSDGDKGDITVSSSGAVWTIDPAVVSNSKLANVATATFKGRTTAGTGSPEDLTVAQAKTLLNLAGTNTGDQTITLTGDVTGSGTGSFAATIPNDTVTNAKAANMATATIKGRATAGTGDPEDLTATQVKTLLAIAAGDVSGLAAIATSGSASDLSGTKPSTFITDFTEAAQDSVGVMVNSTLVYNDATPSLGRAAITGDVTIAAGSNVSEIGLNVVLAENIADANVTFDKLVEVPSQTILGNDSGDTNVVGPITASNVAAMLPVFGALAKGVVPASGGGTSNFLRADGTFAAPPTGGVTDGDKGDITVSSGGTVWTIDNDAVTYGKIQNVTGNSFLGRAASGAGDVGEITVGASELVGRGSTGNITAITLGTNLSMSGTTLNATGGGGISDGDKGDITVSSSGTVWTIDATAVSNAKLADVATATFKGRTTAGTGSPEDLTVAQAKTLLNLAGTNTGDQTITLTGDVTGSGTGSFAATIANDTVTNAKAANMATATIKGRTTAGIGDPEDLTATQVKTLLAISAGDVSGLAAIATSGSAADLSGTKTSAFISDFTEASQDATGAMVDSTLVYNDATPSLGRAAITGDVTISAGSNSSAISNDAVTNAKLANVATATFKGRTTVGTGDPEDLTVAQAKTLLNLVGTNTGDQTITLTGDVTGSGTGSFAATIANGSVTLAKQANLSANSIIGNNTGSAATPIALTATQTTAMLDTFTSSTKGLVPASGGGTTNFLRADGTFAAPPGGGGGSPGGLTTQVQFNNAGSFDGASTLTFASSTAGASFAAGTATAGTWPTLAAGTPLTTPVKGTFEHDTNCLYFTTDAGNRGYIPVIHYTRLASNFALTNSTAEQAIFPVGQRTLTLETGIYRFYGNISLTGMSATTGNMAIDILGAGSAVVGQWMWTAFGRDAANNATGAAMGGSCMTAQQTGASFTTPATATETMAQLAGIFIVTTAGTITPSITLLTASAASTVAGSFFMVERIGAQAATTLGQWS